MHLFLTGPLGCGKSTVVDAVLAGTNAIVGGFRTGFGPDRAMDSHSLYLWPAWEAPQRDETHTVVRFGPRWATPLTHRFDALGAPTLSRPGAQLLVMDECGRFEAEADSFRTAVLSALDGSIPVLGVVREDLPGWTPAIATHPNVELIIVTQENRNTLPPFLLTRLAAVQGGLCPP